MMERRQTKLYRVIHLRTGRVFDFASAEAVANHIFVLGNFDIPSHLIYKNEKRYRWPKEGLMEVSELARKLEAWQISS